MKNNINAQLNMIEKAIKWVHETESMKGTKGENAYKNLVNYRRKLNQKKVALEGNPAAAIYGASQMGKSYLVSNLLSESGSAFNVIDGKGKSYVFLDDINPEGNRREATSIVTRFSTNYKWINAEFPIKVKLLTPADLVLVLCDSYFNDMKTKIDTAFQIDIINEKIKEFCLKYDNKIIQQKLLDEDAILDISDYFHTNFSTKATNIIHSSFFEKIPALISKTNADDWCEIFTLLWNGNEKINNLFSELLKHYALLDFNSEIYVPIETVLRKNGTLLDVARLGEIYGTTGTELNYLSDTSVIILQNGEEKLISNFSKSFLCALTAELTFCVPNELEKSKAFLKNTDLLDFPGARNRLGIHEDELLNEEIPKMLLRGKVAYLFNKYSSSEKINILLFCQNNEKVEVQNIVPDLLNNWIGDMIGKTPEERTNFMLSSKAPPLLIISTMFNIDLQFDYYKDNLNNIDARNNRWKGRFITVFNEIFGSKKWLQEWTTSIPNFQNIYLLRDFRFSSDSFKGYNETKTEIEEVLPENFPNFRKVLRQSFIEYDFVKNHFLNPEHSWDRAASINEDGSQLILDQLTFAAKNINIARYEKTKIELKTLNELIITYLKEFYNSPDKAESLLQAIAKAGSIQADLDITFGRNPYFFGSMMRELMITNSDVYHLYLGKIRELERRDVINMDKYSAIRLNVHQLNPNQGFDMNLECLRKHYEMKTLKECQDFFEIERGVNLNELFYGNNTRVKSFSDILAKELEKFWFEDFMIRKHQNLSEIVSVKGMQDLKDMLQRLYEKLNITELIAEKIRRYVDGYRNIEDVYEMIADISAEMVNKFINTVGLGYYNESNFNDLKKASENINRLSWEHHELQFAKNTKQEVAELITQMGNLPELLNQNPLSKEKLKFLPNYRNYIMWYDFLKAGFVTVSGVPNYDPIANDKLGVIIKEIENLVY
ncbi:MAG: virulence factor SrfC family protein [Limnohabitans sp.]|nr:virulence factor SrfC family protein [Limnohabitans sp.]